jgi:integrase
VSNLFNQGFFQYPASYNLTNWDEEDAEILVSDYLLNRKLSNKTINKIVNSIARLCKYARDELNIFTNVHFPLESEKSGLVLTRRNNIFGLLELDLITSEVMDEEEDGEQLACILDLAFYAGLRSGEIANLTLNSIVANENEIIIYLPKFKTPSAYRSIPLHLLAPPNVCRRVQSVIESRFIQLRKFNNKSRTKLSLEQCYLFSVDGKVDDCSSPDMIYRARSLLKIKSGEGADLHLLRHSFASHIFLRWYCCRYDDLIHQLLEQDHWCFTAEGISSLRRILGEDPDCPLPPTNITSIIHLLKLMGHKTTTTFFRVYVHSFEVVARHTLERSLQEEEQQILSGKAIAALIPSCKSRTSQAKIKDKSFSGLAQWVRNQN